MHNAPSVSYPVGRSLVAGLLALAAWLLGALAIAQWTAQSQVHGWRLAVAAFALMATALVCAWNWRQMPRGTLEWDGQCWRWKGSAADDAGTVEVCLDLQRFLLVRWQGEAKHHWLWLERARHPERWDGLRRAVYSRARPQALPQAGPGAAEP